MHNMTLSPICSFCASSSNAILWCHLFLKTEVGFDQSNLGAPASRHALFLYSVFRLLHLRSEEMGEESRPFLKNSYWILRHGKSIPNEKGIVVSSMENGTLPEFSLSADGIHQANLAGELLKKEIQACNADIDNARIFYSPFSRTTQTAKVVANVLSIPFDGFQCKAIAELRERYFGPTFELKSHEKYSEIWALDEKDPFLPPEGGESVSDVASRLRSAITAIEAEFQGCIILVVSHGDPLQILQTIISAAKDHEDEDLSSRIKGVTVPSILSHHRKFALETGELRRVV